MDNQDVISKEALAGGRRGAGFIGMICLIAAVACDDGKPASGGAGGAGGSSGDACQVVSGKTYRSISTGECGLGPSGLVYCTWSIVFAADQTFSWMHSDYGVQGTYACNGAAITGSSGDRGTLDFQTGLLTWDGVAYAPLS